MLDNAAPWQPYKWWLWAVAPGVTKMGRADPTDKEHRGQGRAHRNRRIDWNVLLSAASVRSAMVFGFVFAIVAQSLEWAWRAGKVGRDMGAARRDHGRWQQGHSRMMSVKRELEGERRKELVVKGTEVEEVWGK